VIKTDGNGKELWSRIYGRDDVDYGFSVQQTADGGYIIGGHTGFWDADFVDDVYLIKTDGSGNEIWSKTYGGSEVDRGYCVRQTTDGGYVIIGGTESFGAGSADVYLIKTDSEGKSLWSKTFGGEGHECGGAVRETADGGYIISGYTYSFGAGNADVYLIYYNPEVDVPVVNRLKPRSSSHGEVVRIIGGNFGDMQGDSVVHIGKKSFGSASPEVVLWTHSKIKVSVPQHECEWFKGRDYRKQKVWVTVDGIDSNSRRLKILKPDICP